MSLILFFLVLAMRVFLTVLVPDSLDSLRSVGPVHCGAPSPGMWLKYSSGWDWDNGLGGKDCAMSRVHAVNTCHCWLWSWSTGRRHVFRFLRCKVTFSLPLSHTAFFCSRTFNSLTVLWYRHPLSFWVALHSAPLETFIVAVCVWSDAAKPSAGPAQRTPVMMPRLPRVLTPQTVPQWTSLCPWSLFQDSSGCKTRSEPLVIRHLPSRKAALVSLLQPLSSSIISLPDTCQAEGHAVPLAHVQVGSLTATHGHSYEACFIQVVEPYHTEDPIWQAEDPRAPLLGWHNS